MTGHDVIATARDAHTAAYLCRRLRDNVRSQLHTRIKKEVDDWLSKAPGGRPDEPSQCVKYIYELYVHCIHHSRCGSSHKDGCVPAGSLTPRQDVSSSCLNEFGIALSSQEQALLRGGHTGSLWLCMKHSTKLAALAAQSRTVCHDGSTFRYRRL